MSIWVASNVGTVSKTSGSNSDRIYSGRKLASSSDNSTATATATNVEATAATTSYDQSFIKGNSTWCGPSSGCCEVTPFEYDVCLLAEGVASLDDSLVGV
jgi:hypothetical protein